MKSKFPNYLGICVGVLIIVFSVVVFCSTGDVLNPHMNEIEPITGSGMTPEIEIDKSYGGDAYSGMQQAAAQAANNLIPVYDSINQTNAGLEAVNTNLARQTSAQANNISVLINAFGFLLLSVGLLTVAKYVALLMNDTQAAVPTSPVAKVHPAVTTAPSPTPTTVKPAAPASPAPKAPTENKFPEMQTDAYWRCQKCGVKNLISRTDCWRCGSPK